MEWIIGNRYLTDDEKKNNAQIVCDYMLEKGWTFEAICGMLGNMETESNINPGLWESLIPFGDPTAHGYGLVQWTPYTIITNWLTNKGYDITDGYGQLEKIIEEVDDGSQWIPTAKYPMSFQEFIHSSESPDYLAMVFICNYERPGTTNQPIRGTQALNWYNCLDSSGHGSGGHTEGVKVMKNIIGDSDCFIFPRKFNVIGETFSIVSQFGDYSIIKNSKGVQYKIKSKYLEKK